MAYRKTLYHVFTHGLDEWFYEYEPALDLYKQLVKECGSARLYEEIYIDDESEEENCLKAHGSYPW